jgi:hypothetical protein
VYSQYSYTRGKSKHTVTEVFLLEFAYTRYDVPWFVEWMIFMWHKDFYALSFAVQLSNTFPVAMKLKVIIESYHQAKASRRWFSVLMYIPLSQMHEL